MKEKKETTSKESGRDGKEEGHKPPKKFLHQMVTTQNHDGTLTHSHHYKDHPDHPHHSLVRENAATSQNPADAGQHVEDQFAMNQMGGGEPEGDEAQPGAAGQAGAETGGVPAE